MGHVWNTVEHALGHVASIAVGIVLTLAGLAMTCTLVLGIPGVIIAVVGVALVVGGFVRHSSRRARINHS